MKAVSSLALILGTAVAATSAHAITAEQALLQFDQKVRNYNLVAFGDVTMTGGMDTEAGIAVKGNLTLSGNWSIGSHPSEFNANTDPTLFVSGGLSIASGSEVRLENGYASMQNIDSGWSWSTAQNKLTKSNNGALSTINSPHAKGDISPKTNAGPSGWSWTTMQNEMIALSNTLNSLTDTATVAVNTANQTLEFKAKAGATGPLVVDLDLNKLSGNYYDGKYFSNVNFILPTNTSIIVNVLNAGADEIFFGNGINFNGQSYASRLLWNFVDASPSTFTNLRLGNGGEFSGSVLAATYNVSNYNNSILNGQIVTNKFDLSCNELHFAGFNPPEVPEPRTYGVIAAALCLAGLVVRSRSRGN